MHVLYYDITAIPSSAAASRRARIDQGVKKLSKRCFWLLLRESSPFVSITIITDQCDWKDSSIIIVHRLRVEEKTKETNLTAYWLL